MAENRFSKFAKQPVEAPPVVAGGNRFAKFKTAPVAISAPPVTPLQQPPMQAVQGKGDFGMGPGEMSGISQFEDVLKSAGTGIVQGVAGLAGLPGDIQQLSGTVASFIADKAGASPETQQFVKSAAEKLSLPTPFMPMGAPSTADVTGGIEATFGPLYKPKTTAGEYANTAGQFAPNAMLGPGRVAAKAGTGLLSAVASETAGQLTKGSDYETLARVAGGVAGGLGGVKTKSPTKMIAKNAPTQEIVKAEADSLYRNLRDSGVVYDSNTFDRTVGFIAQKLQGEGFRKAQASKAFDLVDMLSEKIGQRVDFNDIESMQKTAKAILREVPGSVTQTDKAAASIVLDALDQFASRAPMITNGKIAPKDVAGLTKQARELARRNIIARDIEEMLSKAETYQSGNVSGLRNQFANYLRSKKGKSLTAEERGAFMEAAKGSVTGNLLSIVGKFGIDPTKLGNSATLLPAMGAGAAYLYNQDPLTAGAVAAIGTGAKFASRGLALSAAERAKKVVLAGREKQGLVAKKVVQDALEARLRAALAARSGAMGE